MARLRPTPRFNPLILALIIVSALLGPPIEPSRASWPSSAGETEELDQLLSAIKVHCVMPDGQLVQVSNAGEKLASLAASMTDAATLRCPLQKGNTTFIISFPRASLVDRFTFVNDNPEIQGDMRIAVSDHLWPANSSKWIQVSGKTKFSNRRLFNLSMIGVEARFVKLSFRVDKEDQIAAAQLDRANH